MNDNYDYIIFTNLPAFYKINLYNQLAKKLKIKVVFMSASSSIRPDDFTCGDMAFEHVFLSDNVYEKRNKFLVFMKVMKILFSSRYKMLLFPGWELVELIPFMLLLQTNKNGILLESSIVETRSTGLLWLLKKIIIKNMGHAFPSGHLQHKILELAGYPGCVHVTHGVGIAKRSKDRITSLSIVPNQFNYLYVGRVSAEKNLKYLIEMFNCNGKKLTIVGDGPLMDELKLIAKQNVTFLGYVNNEQLADVYRSHDIFILPSNSEPWGLVIDEALWFGLPVVVSCNVGCSEDLVIKEKTGSVFVLNNDVSFNNALSDVELNYSKYKKNVMKIDFDRRDQDQINAYLN
ncbi:glycosyltransferase [Providencia huaxiensis]|uniref:glycosyltransferase n=1 Tax=Providencia huaxiensis TaxID=2027290 RepID=UPI0034E58BE3